MELGENFVILEKVRFLKKKLEFWKKVGILKNKKLESGRNKIGILREKMNFEKIFEFGILRKQKGKKSEFCKKS